MAALPYWLWLTNRKFISTGTAFRLLEQFGSPEAVYFADPAEYELVEGISSGACEELRNKSLDVAERILGECDRMGVTVLTLQDAQYPERLRQLPDPPAVLYVKGKLFHFDDEVAVGVVGSRKATPYGIKVAGQLGLELTRQGALVVSGIARGVDSAAVRGALQAGGGPVSVLGNGVDVYYPETNRELYEDVAAAGALISEYPPGTRPNGRFFPVRNRIISGLSLGVTVVEGTETSGSLITARLALDQNRDVFAVPGNIDAPESRGPNLLIAKGEAYLIRNAWDILQEYAPRYPNILNFLPKLPPETERQKTELTWILEKNSREESKKVVDKESGRTYIDLKDDDPELTEDERDILLALNHRDMTGDDLTETAQIPVRRVLSALTMLQVRGMVEERPDRKFRSLIKLKAE